MVIFCAGQEIVARKSRTKPTNCREWREEFQFDKITAALEKLAFPPVGIAYAKLVSTLSAALYTESLSDDKQAVFDVAPVLMVSIAEKIGEPAVTNLYLHELVAHLGAQTRETGLPPGLMTDERGERVVGLSKDGPSDGTAHNTFKIALLHTGGLLAVPRQPKPAYRVRGRRWAVHRCLFSALLVLRVRGPSCAAEGGADDDILTISFTNPAEDAEACMEFCICGHGFESK